MGMTHLKTVLPPLCLLLYSIVAHSEGDDMVIITDINVDGWLDDWGWGYSRIQRRREG